MITRRRLLAGSAAMVVHDGDGSGVRTVGDCTRYDPV